MRLRLYKTDKRYNSTKRIELNEELEPPIRVYEDVYLKQKTDLDFPTFELDGTLYDANYVYIDDWDSFYYIRKFKKGNHDIYEIECEIDVLATFKTQILAQRLFIEYSSSHYSSKLIDNRVAMLTDVDIITASAASVFTTRPSYILSVVGEDGINCIIPSDPNVIPATLYQKQVSDLVSALFIQWSDAQACLLELREVPIAVGADYSLSPAHVGKIEVGERAALNQYFNGAREEQFESIAIPVTYNDFRLFKFVTACLFLPMVGVVELDLEAFQPDPSVTGLVKIHTIANPLSGSVVYTLKNASDEIVASYTGSFGRTLPINATRPSDLVGAITHIVAAGASAASGIAFGTLSQSVAAVSDSLKYRGSVIGSFGGSYGEYAGTDFVLTVEKHKSNIEPSNLTDLVGRPYYKVDNLSNKTGFIKTVGAKVQIATTADRLNRIETLLDNGIYIE